jgi:urea transport system substrate-binding protein
MSSSPPGEYTTAWPPAPEAALPEARADTSWPPETSAGSQSPPPAAPPPVGPGLLAHYRILKPLGQGGMGLVYQAEDTRLHRPVALKVMHTALTAQPAARERFLREARAVAAVHNDHVVTIYEVGEADEIPFLAMELLHGRTLEECLCSGPPPHVGDILRIGREIATGLAAAHQCGLVHRDIKPANLWLEAPAGRVKILDFGLARPVDRRDGLTRTGDVLGTPSYMAPEQALGNPVDARCDLFSLGVVLYRLSTGDPPFRGNSLAAVLMATAMETPRPMRERNPGIPPALADLVMRLLEKDPAGRPASAQEVAAALRTMEAQGASGWDGSALPAPGPGPTPASTQSHGRAGPTSADRDGARPSSSAVAGRRRRLAGAGLALLVGAAVLSGWALTRPAREGGRPGPAATVRPAGPPIRIGVLYSRTGTMALSERPVLDGALLAVEEINDRGGLLGRPIEAVIEDGESDETVFAAKATKLIEQEHAVAVVGCWTSASRKAVKAVVEGHDHLLLYPVSYEGMEQSGNIVYGGSVPNQQILPALRWCYGFLNKKRWALVGSDSLFSHAAHAVIQDEARLLGSQVVGEEFLPLGGTDVGGMVSRIKAADPDLIVNTIAGDTNVAFFRALHQAGIRPDRAPTLSFNVSEEELSGLTPGEVVGQYAGGNYFQSLGLPENQAFLRRVRARLGPERIVSDPMQTAYALVHLWAQAVRAAGSDDVRAVRGAIKGHHFDAPQGPVTIDSGTLHTVQISRVGRVDAEGHFQEVFLSPQPVTPEPFPASRSQQAWEALLEDLHRRWGGQWHNRGA